MVYKPEINIIFMSTVIKTKFTKCSIRTLKNTNHFYYKSKKYKLKQHKMPFTT